MSKWDMRITDQSEAVHDPRGKQNNGMCFAHKMPTKSLSSIEIERRSMNNHTLWSLTHSSVDSEQKDSYLFPEIPNFYATSAFEGWITDERTRPQAHGSHSWNQSENMFIRLVLIINLPGVHNRKANLFGNAVAF